MKPLLSICMMVKNEGKSLQRCLDSLVDLRAKISSELIIIDTGSTDNTVAIAEKYTDKVYFHQWNNNFSEMRNISIGYAKGEWLFIIDADEELESATAIIKFLKSKERKVFHTGGIYVKNFTTDDDFVMLPSPRLFRNDGCFCYAGAVHNMPQFKGDVYGMGAILRHYGYMATDPELMERKFKRTTTILKQELEKNPDSVYYHFQLSSSYGMHGDHQEALDEAIAAYECIKRKNLDPKEYIYVYYQLAKNYFLNAHYEESEKICVAGIDLKDEYIDLYLQLADSQAVLKKNDEAISNYKKYFELLSNYENLTIKGNMSIQMHSLCRSNEAYYNMAVVYREQEKYEEALKCIEKVGKKEFLELKIQMIVELAIKIRAFTKLKEWFQAEISTQDENIINVFISNVEKKWGQLSQEDKYDFCRLFESTSGIYGMLNNLRMQEFFKCEVALLDTIVIQLSDYDINKLPDYYAYVFLLLMYHLPVDAEVLSSKLTESSIMNYMKYLHDLNKPLFMDVCRNFLFNQDDIEDDLYQSTRIRKNIAKYLLFSGDLSNEEYEKVFLSYIQFGSNYMRSIYQEYVFDNELIRDLKNVEEAFLLYVSLSKECENNRKKVDYLGKAIKVYPDMHKGIEILLQDITKPSPQEKEMATLVEKLLKQLQLLVADKQYDTALTIINEFESVGGKDIRLLAMKAELFKKQCKAE